MRISHLDRISVLVLRLAIVGGIFYGLGAFTLKSAVPRRGGCVNYNVTLF